MEEGVLTRPTLELAALGFAAAELQLVGRSASRCESPVWAQNARAVALPTAPLAPSRSFPPLRWLGASNSNRSRSWFGTVRDGLKISALGR